MLLLMMMMMMGMSFLVVVVLLMLNSQKTNQGGGDDTPGSHDKPGSEDKPGSGNSGTDVSSHNTPQDCWVTLNGKAYDLTAYRPEHSGGANKIKCGTDVTAAFEGKHGNSSAFLKKLAQYAK